MDQKRKDIQQSNQFEEVRNLLLNTNVTITATKTQPKGETHVKESSTIEKNNSDQLWDTAAKRRKYYNEEKSQSESEIVSNPLSSLPLSLISNGILSVTSDSSCVAIENGVPILKKAPDDYGKQIPIAKQTGLSIHPLDAVSEYNSKNKNVSNQATEQPQFRNDTNIITPQIYKHYKTRSGVENSNKIDGGLETVKRQDHSGFSFITKALTNVCKVPSINKMAIIPHANQFDFLTLLGLEIVVDSCCSTKPTKCEKQASLFCGQCQTDFTKTWHFYKSTKQIICENCFIYNEYQNNKITQMLKLADEYAKAFHSIQMPGGPHENLNQINSEKFLANRSKEELVQKFIKAAELSNEGRSGGVSDLTRLGASIAASSEVYEAAKAINLLDEAAPPEVRAKYVQLFQIELFKELRQCLSSIGGMDKSIQEQSLLFLQMHIAQMKSQTNENTAQSDTTSMEPLNSILRASETQYQSLLTTIMKQLPQLSCDRKECET